MILWERTVFAGVNAGILVKVSTNLALTSHDMAASLLRVLDDEKSW